MIDILECTLRDASYPISYQFTAEDTAIIATGLFQAGFKRIEIGHGLGLGASSIKYGFAAASDEEYIAAASSVLPPGIFGLFAIPGIAELEALDLVAKYKGGFVRIGTDVKDTKLAESFIKKGKDLGLEVSANLMKTYSKSVSEVVERSLQLQEWGADIIAVVDSAGGMMPEAVRSYIRSLSLAGVKKIGFHGHNNLQLAVANTLIAIESGATMVDATLRGLGRSTGNAQTEALVMCMERLGYNTGIDIFETMDISDKIIAPLARGRGSDSIEIASGYSMFHSGYMPLIEKESKSNGVDIRKLIIAVGDGNGQSINEEFVSKIAKSLSKEADNIAEPDSVKNAINSFQTKFQTRIDAEHDILTLVSEINSVSKKTGKLPVLTITQSINPLIEKLSIPYIHINDSLLIGNVELKFIDDLNDIVKEIDGLVEYILIDESLNVNISNFENTTSKIIRYSEENARVNAIESYLSSIKLLESNKKYLISGINSCSLAFADRLLGNNISFCLYDDSTDILMGALSLLMQKSKLLYPKSEATVEVYDGNSVIDVIASFKLNSSLSLQTSSFHTSTFIIDAYLESFTDIFLNDAKGYNMPVYRLDIRAGLSSEVALRIETQKLISNVLGKNLINEIPVIAGGVIGELGMVVLDSLNHPKKVLGIANGRGGLLSKIDELPYFNSIEKVRGHILLNLFHKK